MRERRKARGCGNPGRKETYFNNDHQNDSKHPALGQPLFIGEKISPEEKRLRIVQFLQLPEHKISPRIRHTKEIDSLYDILSGAVELERRVGKFFNWEEVRDLLREVLICQT